MKRKNRINIFAVAKEAGVSAMTVTRAFNDSAPVAEETRRRVLAAASELGYRPNLMAQGLRGGTTRSIGILLPMHAPFTSAAFIRHVSRAVEARKYSVLVSDALGIEGYTESLRSFRERGVDGVIIHIFGREERNEAIFEKLHEFRAAVCVTTYPMNCSLDMVVHDRCDSSREVVDHLVRNGYRNPLLIIDSKNNLLGQLKQNAFVDRLQAHGIELPPENVVQHGSLNDVERIGDAFLESFFQAIENKVDFDSIWCSTDEGAAAIMDFLNSGRRPEEGASELLHYLQKNPRVPADIAVIGFNNGEMCRYMTPRLASVQRFDDLVARHSVNFLFDRLENPELPLRTETVSMRFVWRESAGL